MYMYIIYYHTLREVDRKIKYCHIIIAANGVLELPGIASVLRQLSAVTKNGFTELYIRYVGMQQTQ